MYTSGNPGFGMRKQGLPCDTLSVKDVLAHMTRWDRWLLMTLPPAPGEPTAPVKLALADQIPASNDRAEEMNANVLAYKLKPRIC